MSLERLELDVAVKLAFVENSLSRVEEYRQQLQENAHKVTVSWQFVFIFSENAIENFVLQVLNVKRCGEGFHIFHDLLHVIIAFFFFKSSRLVVG